MQSNKPISQNERQRLLKQHDYDIFNNEKDFVLDRLDALALEIAGTPIAVYNLVGETQQLSKAKFGSHVDFIPGEESFCQYTINEPSEPLIINDLRSDKRFANSFWEKGEAGLQFYAGFPVDKDDQSTVGALFVLDTTPDINRYANQVFRNIIHHQ